MSWHQVLALLRLPHRGSATPLEAEAFRRLRALLEERGLAPAAIPFRGVPSYGWELHGPRGHGQDLLPLPPREGPGLPAGLFGQRGPGLSGPLPGPHRPGLALGPLLPPPGRSPPPPGAFRPLRGGGNGNGSGVAVATALFLEAESPPGWRLGLALMGCEEVGALGAKALLPHLPTGALVLNRDNVGRGELFYAEGEGMLLFFPYRGSLLEAARKTPGARPVRYRLAYFDTLPLTQRGFSCLTLVCLEGGLPPDWHWPTDTFARLDEGALEGTLNYARSLLERVFQGA